MRSLALAAVLVPALAAAGVRPGYGGTIRVAVPAPPQLGARPSGPADLLVARALSAPLLEVDARGLLAPGALAEVPAPEAEGRAFRLRLRPGLLDAAGRPIGAAELARHLTALLSGELRPLGWVALPILGADAVLEGRASVVAGLQVVSATELLVTLAFPLPEFPWLLATVAAALPDAGPFVAQTAGAPSAPLRLVRSEHHHLGRPFADELILHPADARGAARLLAQGGLDLVLRPEAAGGRPGPALAPLTVTIAVVNPARLGASAEAVRRALAALDRGDLARRFVRGPAEPLTTLVPPAVLPGAPGASSPADPPPAPAPAPARISLLVDGSVPDHRALAERLQVKLFDRGVRAAVERVAGGHLEGRLAAGEYDVALLAVTVQPLRPALAAGQIAFAARGAAAARRAMASLAGLSGDAALAAVDRLARELHLVPLVAAGQRASLGAALQGLAPGADGGIDAGALWLLGGGRR
jgi:peptide/nickel transport system substrate-binding protein